MARRGKTIVGKVTRPVRFRLGAGRISKGSTLHTSEIAATKNMRRQLAKVEKELGRVLNIFQEATSDALEYALEPIYIKAIDLAPIDTGDLVRSAYLETSEGKDSAEAQLGFGRGGNPPYTVMVHENLNFRHDPPTQAKFLETAINEHIGEIFPRMREFLRLQ